MKSLIALLALVLFGQTAHAQTVTLTFSGTAPHPINDQWQVLVNYNLPAGSYTGLEIALTMPDAATHPVLQLISEASSGEWTYALQQVSPTQQRLVWTSANLSTPQAISGQFVVTVRASSNLSVAGQVRATRSGTPFPFSATLQGADGGTPFSDNDFETRTVTGTPTIQWQYAMTPYATYTGVFAGQPALIARYNLRAFVCGNAPVEGFDGSNYGIPFRINLGADLHFLNAWWGDNNGFWPSSQLTNGLGTVLSTPTAFGQVGHTSGGAITARWEAPLLPSSSSCAYTYNFYVDIAYPCNEGPWTWSDPDLHFSVDNPTAAQSGALVEAFSRDFQGNVTTLTLPEISDYNGTNFTSCGGNAGVIKYWDGSSSPGALANWAMNITLPYGSTIDAGTVLVDKLPPTVNPQTDLRTYKLTQPGLSGSQYYWCDLSQEPSTVHYFTGAQLTAYAAANKCQLGVAYQNDNNWSRPPDGMTQVTHFAVLLPATTGQPSSYPSSDGLPLTLGFNLYTQIPPTQSTDYVNCVQIVGSINGGTAVGSDLTQESPSGTPTDDPWEDCATRTIPTLSCPYPYTDPAWFQTTAAPGDCRLWFFYPWRQDSALIPQNPSYRVTVPAGVALMDVAGIAYSESQPDGTQVYGTCGAQSLPAITVLDPEPFPTGVTNSPTTIDITFGSGQNPCLLETSWSNFFAVNFCIDDQRAWANGDMVSFEVEALGADNGPQDFDTQCGGIAAVVRRKVDFVLAVPPEMRAFISGSCSTSGAASFVVEGKNTGGVDLTDADLSFELPVGATLASALMGEAPAGAILEMADLASGPWVPVDAPSATARFVRLRLPAGVVLPPVSGNRMTFTVELATNAGAGTVLTATGTLSAEPLNEPAVGQGSFTVGSCVPVTIQKFWDIDGDGTRDGPEPGLSGWLFEVTTSLGGLVAQPVTESDGEVVVLLPAGTYSVAELLPPSPAAETPNWSPTTGGVSQDVVIAVGGAAQTLTFGNECGCPEDTDDNLCTERTCVRVANDEVVDIKDFACSEEAPIDCDGNACTTQVCDPQVGCTPSSSEDSACEEEVVYYLPVRHSVDGLTAALRCVVPTDGSPPYCDTEAGALKLYVGQGDMCGSDEGGGSSR